MAELNSYLISQKKQKKPVRGAEIAELAGIDKKEVDKAIKSLKRGKDTLTKTLLLRHRRVICRFSR